MSEVPNIKYNKSPNSGICDKNNHRDLKSTSHKHLGIRILTLPGLILGHGESKKGCLSSGGNRSAHSFLSTFVRYIVKHIA